METHFLWNNWYNIELQKEIYSLQYSIFIAKMLFSSILCYKNASNNYFIKNVIPVRISSIQQHFVIGFICNSKFDNKKTKNLLIHFHQDKYVLISKISLLVTVYIEYKTNLFIILQIDIHCFLLGFSTFSFKYFLFR